MDVKQFNEELEQDEGRRNFAYDDATGNRLLSKQVLHGNLTAGVGRNLSARGFSADEIDLMRDNDRVAAMTEVAQHFPWWVTLNDARQRVLVNMCFNLGIDGLMSFTTFLTYVKNGEYDKAADDLLTTEAAKEAVTRYQRLSGQIRNGV